jgi:hypothetical protein
MSQIAEHVDREDSHVSLTARAVNDGKPLAIMGNSYVRRRARQGNRFVENSPLAYH